MSSEYYRRQAQDYQKEISRLQRDKGREAERIAKLYGDINRASENARLRELTPLPLIIGALLGMVFGASSLYLVLKVGLTITLVAVWRDRKRRRR